MNNYIVIIKYMLKFSNKKIMMFIYWENLGQEVLSVYVKMEKGGT